MGRQGKALPGIASDDGRAIEAVATGLMVARGLPHGVDATMVRLLHGDGEPRQRADIVPGVALEKAEQDKAETYSELVDSEVVKLTTLACEVGGRWSDSCADVLARLAAARARAAPRHLQLSVRVAFESHWWALLSIAQ